MPVEHIMMGGLACGPEHEILNFQEKQSLQDQTDAYNIFNPNNPLYDKPLRMSSTAHGISINQHPEFILNFQRRLLASGVPLDFWALTRSDLPLQLRESNRSPLAHPSILDSQEVENQLLSNGVGPFANEILVRDIMNLVIRHDGMSSLHRLEALQLMLPRCSFVYVT